MLRFLFLCALMFIALPAYALTVYKSPSFSTDLHQRPQVSFSWSPLSPFAGDTVTFDAALSMVYSGGSMTPVSGSNASLVWSTPPGGSLITFPYTLSTSGQFDISLAITDATGNVCFPVSGSGTTANQACMCSVTKSGVGTGLTVSKPKPIFREIKP